MKNVILTENEISKLSKLEKQSLNKFKEKFDDPECPPLKDDELNDFHIVEANTLDNRNISLQQKFPEWFKARKETITIRLDKEVVARYKAMGRGYQTRINLDLRNALGLDNKK